MKRLCLLIPDIITTKRIADHVKANGVSEHHVHVLGKSTLAIEHLHLHRANVFQTTKLPHALLMGSLSGFLLGLVLGVSLVWLSPWGLILSASGVVVFTLIGIILGLWISGLVGISVQNSIVEQARPKIQQGKYLMMIDLKNNQVQVLTAQILQRFPKTEVTSPTLH